MSLHRGIKERVNMFFRIMSKIPFQVRFSKNILKRIDHLIESEEYASRSDLINEAVINFLDRKDNGMHFLMMLDTPEFRAKVLEIVENREIK